MGLLWWFVDEAEFLPLNFEKAEKGRNDFLILWPR